MTPQDAIASLEKSLSEGDELMKSYTWSGGSFKSQAVRAVITTNADLRKLLMTCRARIKAQTDVGLISQDPENEDPQHEFQELLPDLDAALGLSD